MSAAQTAWTRSLRPLTANRLALLIVRIALGGLLITSGASKFQDQPAFSRALLAYGMLPHPLGVFYAAVLPWAEIFIGCCLVLGVFTVLAAGLTVPLVVSFTIANIYAMVHPIGPAAECSCLGTLVRLTHPVSLTIDVAMLLAAVLLISGRNRAGAISIGIILDKASADFNRKARPLLALLLIAILVVSIAAAVPAKSVLAKQGVDEALKQGTPVLLFVYGEEEQLRQEAAVLSDIEVRYDQVDVVRLQYSDARPDIKQFDIHALPALVVITGKARSGGYLVTAVLEGSVDEKEVISLLDSLTSR